MRRTRVDIWTHLAVEELESRSMLSAVPLSSGLGIVTSVNDQPGGGPGAFIGSDTGGTQFDGNLITSQAGNGTLVGGGLLADVTNSEMLAISASQNPGQFSGGFNAAGVFSAMIAGALDPTNPMNPRLANASTGLNATDGTGQMTIANGANTLGLAATPTNGFYSNAGGTGGPVVPRAPKSPPPSATALDGADLEVDTPFAELEPIRADDDLLVLAAT